jgi:putative oxidoreductase
LQRLFSTFPDGWPGTGLAVLRMVTAIAVVQNDFPTLWPASYALAIVQTVATGAAGLLLAGLWTPVAGGLTAVAELCFAFWRPADPGMHVLVGALGVALAMLGPGAWSVDARLFGRKRIQIPTR